MYETDVRVIRFYSHTVQFAFKSFISSLDGFRHRTTIETQCDLPYRGLLLVITRNTTLHSKTGETDFKISGGFEMRR